MLSGFRRHLTNVPVPDTTVAVCFRLFETESCYKQSSGAWNRDPLLPQPPQSWLHRCVLHLPAPAFLVIVTGALNDICTNTVLTYIWGN